MLIREQVTAVLESLRGVWDESAVDELGHPWWPDALRLRRFDDAAKDPAARGADIGTVVAVAERVAGRLT